MTKPGHIDRPKNRDGTPGRHRLRMTIRGKQETVGYYGSWDEADRARDAMAMALEEIELPADASTRGGVYFIQYAERTDGPIKIGKARDVWARLDDLQVACPYRLRILHYERIDEEGARSARESELHERFAASCIRGEWYRATEELLALIVLLKSGAKP